MIRSISTTHYVTPLREGGSLPAIVEGDDEGTWVLKFRGAGQGPRALIAELVAGEIGRLLGLPVPEIVFVNLDPRMAKTEPDEEIQDLLRRSEGLNLALDYLPGSIAFDPLVGRPLTSAISLAGRSPQHHHSDLSCALGGASRSQHGAGTADGETGSSTVVTAEVCAEQSFPQRSV